MKKLSKSEFYNLLKTAEENGNVKYEYDKIYEWEPMFNISDEEDLNYLYEHYKYAVENKQEKVDQLFSHGIFTNFKFKNNKLVEFSYNYDPSDMEKWTYYFKEKEIVEETEEVEEVEEVEELKNEDLLKSINMLNNLFN